MYSCRRGGKGDLIILACRCSDECDIMRERGGSYSTIEFVQDSAGAALRTDHEDFVRLGVVNNGASGMFYNAETFLVDKTFRDEVISSPRAVRDVTKGDDAVLLTWSRGDYTYISTTRSRSTAHIWGNTFP